MPALHTVHLGFLGQPRLGGRTSGAAEALRPSEAHDVLPACVFGGEAAVEIGERTGKIGIDHADTLLNGVT
jgi:hypothetical protein